MQIDWGAADFVMAGAKPAELSARLRLLRAHVPVVDEADDDRIDVGDLVIDVTAYTARLRGTILDPDLQGVRAAEVPGRQPGAGPDP